MSDTSTPDFTGAMARIKRVTKCATQHELGEFLGIRQSSISDAKKRGRIPSDWLLTLWRIKGADPDWVLTGQGARMLQPADSAGTAVSQYVYVKETRPPEECSSQELINALIRRAFLGRQMK